MKSISTVKHGIDPSSSAKIWAARAFSVAMALFTVMSARAESNWGLNLGVSYNSGGYGYGGGGYAGGGAYGVPSIGYGAGAGSIGAIGGCFQQQQVPIVSSCSACAAAHAAQGYPQGYPQGGYSQYPTNGYPNGPIAQGPQLPSMPLPQMPVMPPMPAVQPPAPILPPHLSQPNMGWGPQFASYPGPVYPGLNQGSSCVPCSLHMNVPVVSPVPGGPVVEGGGGYLDVGMGLLASGQGGFSLGGGGSFYAENEWQKDDTASIVLAAGIGMGMQATNVYPIAIPRNEPTIIAPAFINQGTRQSDLIARPAH